MPWLNGNKDLNKLQKKWLVDNGFERKGQILIKNVVIPKICDPPSGDVEGNDAVSAPKFSNNTIDQESASASTLQHPLRSPSDVSSQINSPRKHLKSQESIVSRDENHHCTHQALELKNKLKVNRVRVFLISTISGTYIIDCHHEGLPKELNQLKPDDLGRVIISIGRIHKKKSNDEKQNDILISFDVYDVVAFCPVWLPFAVCGVCEKGEGKKFVTLLHHLASQVYVKYREDLTTVVECIENNTKEMMENYTARSMTQTKTVEATINEESVMPDEHTLNLNVIERDKDVHRTKHYSMTESTQTNSDGLLRGGSKKSTGSLGLMPNSNNFGQAAPTPLVIYRSNEGAKMTKYSRSEWSSRHNSRGDLEGSRNEQLPLDDKEEPHDWSINPCLQAGFEIVSNLLVLIQRIISTREKFSTSTSLLVPPHPDIGDFKEEKESEQKLMKEKDLIKKFKQYVISLKVSVEGKNDLPSWLFTTTYWCFKNWNEDVWFEVFPTTFSIRILSYSPLDQMMNSAATVHHHRISSRVEVYRIPEFLGGDVWFDPRIISQEVERTNQMIEAQRKEKKRQIVRSSTSFSNISHNTEKYNKHQARSHRHYKGVNNLRQVVPQTIL